MAIMMLMLTKLLMMTMVVEAETRAPLYLARHSSRLPYADVGDAHTPGLFDSGHEGIPASTPSYHLLRRAKSTHKAHMRIFLQRFGPPFG
jgi:hypothetical protein